MKHATANKRAVEALTIILFIVYVVLTIVAHVTSLMNKGGKLSYIAYATKKLMNEIAYKYWYIFFIFAMYHVISPWAFPTIMLWI